MNRAGDTHSSEANLEANPDGSKLYGVWTQWVYDETGEEIIESDAMARRIWWIDDYICEAEEGENPAPGRCRAPTSPEPRPIRSSSR